MLEVISKSNLPSDWQSLPLQDFVTEYRGGASLRPSDFVDDGFEVVPKKGIVYGGKLQLNQDDGTYCSSEFAELNTKNIIDNTYLVTTLRDLVPTGPSIGLIVRFFEEKKYMLAQGVYGFKINGNINPDFLTVLSNFEPYRQKMFSLAVGSTQIHIRTGDFFGLKIPVPPIKEQNRITEILNAWDEAIGKLELLITTKQKRKRALMQQLLTGKKRFKEYLNNSWIQHKMEDLGTSERPVVKAGPFGSSLKKEFYVESGYKIYGQEQVISDDPYFGDYYIDKERYESLKSCTVLPDDILMSLVGTIGKVLLVPNDAEIGVINPRLLRLSFDKNKVSPIFAKHYLESAIVAQILDSWAQGGTMGVLNAKMVKSLPMPVPSLPEQQKIASVLSSADAEISTHQTQLEALKTQKRGLTQQLLTGKKRVKVEA